MLTLFDAAVSRECSQELRNAASNTAHLETCVLFTSYLMDNTLSVCVQDIPIERPTVRNQFIFFQVHTEVQNEFS